jgi:glycosyltransferase involved in cell wall biosynthesis
MTPSFSIVIPAYNYGHCLERAVRSALNQNHANFDVLVIDDGSTDDTPQVIERLLAENDSKLRCLRQNNAGLAAVRNRGVKETTGDWLIFLDADDELLPHALSVLAETMTSAPQAVLIIGNHETDDGKQRKAATPAAISNRPEKNFHAYLWKKLNISNGACAMHRSLFDAFVYTESLRINEDTPVFAAILASNLIAATERPVTVIHKHLDSMRNDLEAILKLGLSLENAIFDNPRLPTWAAKYRKPYRAKRALSLLKLAARNGHHDLVRHFLKIAFLNAPFQALNPRYLRRFLASLWTRRKPRADRSANHS